MKIYPQNKVHIRFTAERLNHILTNHPEMEDSIDLIPEIVSDPDMIFEGAKEEYIAVLGSNKYHLVVIYKEEGRDGFIITAFKTRSIQYLLKRKLIWKKQ